MLFVVPEMHFFFSPLKAKLLYLSSVTGHFDACCRLIKCLPLHLEFIRVSDIHVETEINILIELSSSLATDYLLHLIHT